MRFYDHIDLYFVLIISSEHSTMKLPHTLDIQLLSFSVLIALDKIVMFFFPSIKMFWSVYCVLDFLKCMCRRYV